MFQFQTKARTLESLQKIIKTAVIAPPMYFVVHDWEKKTSQILRKISDILVSDLYIVRSSCHDEDSKTSSQAGKFETILNVGNSYEELSFAIDQVIRSYGSTVNPKDEVLIQPMLKNVILSGVAFSCDPLSKSPYYKINWQKGNDTTSITGGKESGSVFYYFPVGRGKNAPKEIRPVISLLDELTSITDTPIDCEFAVVQKESKTELYLLQARPLVLNKEEVVSTDTLNEQLKEIEEYLQKIMSPKPFYKGNKTVLGVMPDWNPAEIIGINPKPLSLSLYKMLVTDATWAYQRYDYGYKDMRGCPLMLDLLGLPYIDVRLSFNSFIPFVLSDNLTERLVNYYIDKLISNPSLHDKIEFEIVFSCYSFDIDQKLQDLKEKGFSSKDCDEIKESLRVLTNKILNPKDGLWRADANRIKNLGIRREEILNSKTTSLVDKIYWLLEDARRYGTLPFAGLARAGFVAIQILKSLVNIGVFSESDYNNFLSSVSTVSSQLIIDRQNLDKATFLSRYGHLRPGTYDITSPRYDEDPDKYFEWNNLKQTNPKIEKPFSLTLDQFRQIDTLLKEHQIEATPIDLFDFIQSSIELREKAKFEFTKNLSIALSFIDKLGSEYGFTTEEIAFSNINVINNCYSSSKNLKEELAQSIEKGKASFAKASHIVLPHLIINPKDIYGFLVSSATPNFITQQKVSAPVVTELSKETLPGAIVCIPNADPGFDWIFSYPIAGLITAWGGANSHMAIRAGELSLPAAIGVGEQLYQQCIQAKHILIDCATKKIEFM